MAPLAELLLGVVVLAGVFGAATQLYPGGLLIVGALLVWALGWSTATAWLVFAIGVAAVAVTGVVKYLVAGGRLKRAGVPNSTLLIGAALAIVGMFVIPVVGLPLGFVAGVYVAEHVRHRSAGPAWAATREAIAATLWTILIELIGAMVAVGAWAVGLIVVN